MTEQRYSPFADLCIAYAVRKHELVTGTDHCPHPSCGVPLVILRICVVDRRQASASRDLVRIVSIGYNQAVPSKGGTYVFLRLVLIQYLPVPCVLDEVSPTATEDGILLLARYRTTLQAEACVDCDAKDIEIPTNEESISNLEEFAD